MCKRQTHPHRFIRARCRRIFLSASSAPDWNFRKILADIELPTQLAGDLSRSIRSNDIGGWMPHDHSDLPFTLGLAKHIGCADGF